MAPQRRNMSVLPIEHFAFSGHSTSMITLHDSRNNATKGISDIYGPGHPDSVRPKGEQG